MSSARLYAVEISGVIVTVRAEVVVPSRAERADGDDQTWVDFDAVNGVRIQEFTCELSDAEWRVLEEAVIDAECERRGVARLAELEALEEHMSA